MLVRLILAAGFLGPVAIPGTQASSPQRPVDRTANQPATDANKVTISGCVRPGVSADSFILSNGVITRSAPGGDVALTKGPPSVSRPPSAFGPATAAPPTDQPLEAVIVHSFKMIAVAYS